MGGGADGQVLRAHQRPCGRPGLPDPLPMRRLPESDPSYLPELRAYADDLRREREAMLAAGAADWAVGHVSRQLEVIVGHVRAHEGLLERLENDERALVEQASVTLRKARQSVPVAFGHRRATGG
jgi:hypothetical protein